VRDQPRRAQGVGRDGRAGIEGRLDLVEVHHGVLRPEDVREAALGHAAMERHLAALEAALVRIARARLRALVAAARRLAVARPGAPADALLRELGPARGLEIIQRSEERRVGEESECLSAIPLVDYH